MELVFKRCSNYLTELNDGTLIKHIIEHCHANETGESGMTGDSGGAEGGGNDGSNEKNGGA